MPRSSRYARAESSTTPRSSPTTTAPARCASSASTPIMRLVVVAHVGALRRGTALRHPPQAEQPDDVVDAHPAGVPEHIGDEIAERRVGELGEPIGSPRRLLPVLPDLVEGVRRCAHADAGGVRVAQAPRIRPARMHAHGEVVHDAERHSGAHGAALRPLQLTVELPLQPHLEVDVVAHSRPRTRRPRCSLAFRSASGHARASLPCSVARTFQVANWCRDSPCNSRKAR